MIAGGLAVRRWLRWTQMGNLYNQRNLRMTMGLAVRRKESDGFLRQPTLKKETNPCSTCKTSSAS